MLGSYLAAVTSRGKLHYGSWWSFGQWEPLYHEDARDNTNSEGLCLVTVVNYVPPPQTFTTFPHSATKLGIKYSNTWVYETFQIQTITDTAFLVRDCWVWVPFSRCSSQQILLLYFLSGLGPFLHFLTPHLSVGEGTMCFLPPGWSWRRCDCNIRLYCCEHDLWSHGKLCVNHFPAPADYVILTEQPKYSVPQAQ